jgi:hypothetical protein
MIGIETLIHDKIQNLSNKITYIRVHINNYKTITIELSFVSFRSTNIRNSNDN